jgi:HAD superfamily hydrolase (TIGR01490 family)
MKSAAFFDLDKTIIAKSSTLAFTKPLFRAGYLSRTTLAKAAIGQAFYQAFGADHGQMERVKEELGKLTSGWRREEITSVVEQTVDEVVAPLAYAEALAIIDDHRRAGRRIVVISSSPEEIVRPLCRYLAIDEVIATRAEVDSEGRYTGNIEFYAFGSEKAQAIRDLAAEEGIDLESSYAYSDSATDIPMLESVGHPVAVNPDDDLLKVASEQGWEIRWFQSAVTIRDRVGRAAPSLAAAGGVAAAAIYIAFKKKRS